MKWLAALVLLSSFAMADDLVVITRQGCPPCSKLKRDLLQMPALYSGHSIRLLEGKDAMEKWRVNMVPTVVRLRNGREVARRVGYSKPKDITDWLRQHD